MHLLLLTQTEKKNQTNLKVEQREIWRRPLDTSRPRSLCVATEGPSNKALSSKLHVGVRRKSQQSHDV